MQNRRSLIRAPNPNSVSSIHPRALAPSWPPRCYASHISCCRGSRRLKTQTERVIAFYAGVREKEIASGREREKETRMGREWWGVLLPLWKLLLLLSVNLRSEIRLVTDMASRLSPSSTIDDATSTSGSSSIGYMEHTVSKLDTLAGVAIKYGVEVTNSLSRFFQPQISTL
jgi:hypothetical protein